MKLRSSRQRNYHRDLSRRSTHRANERMREEFLTGQGGLARRVARMKHRALNQIMNGWTPLVGWWDKGVGMRLRGSDAQLLANDQAEEKVRRIVTQSVIDEIMENPKPFVQMVLEDQVLEEEPFYKAADKSVLERMRDHIGWR